MARTDNVYALPENLPVPVDDGACAHLPDMAVPKVFLVSTAGGSVSLLAESETAWAVVFVYPRTGRPDQELPSGWNATPGARGCTPQATAIRDRYDRFVELGARPFGLSTQDPDYQSEVATRLKLPYPLLSDADWTFAGALRLPTFVNGGQNFLRRTTLFLRHGRVVHVQYPVFPPDGSADLALGWLRDDARAP